MRFKLHSYPCILIKDKRRYAFEDIDTGTVYIRAESMYGTMAWLKAGFPESVRERLLKGKSTVILETESMALVPADSKALERGIL